MPGDRVCAGPAHAQTRVGEAAVVQNEVVRVAGPATSQINVGDGVLRNETVRTGTDSAARLVMIDSTNLSLGPNATLTLDRTVFNDEHLSRHRDPARDRRVPLRHRAFRQDRLQDHDVAGDIGVRGTILDILTQRGQTTVGVQEASSVCT